MPNCNSNNYNKTSRLAEKIERRNIFKGNGEGCVNITPEIDYYHLQNYWSRAKNHPSLIFKSEVIRKYSGQAFEELIPEMRSLTTENEVFKKIIRSGDGDTLPDNSFLHFHYNTFLDLVDHPFDASIFYCIKPCTYHLGTDTYFPGLELALKSMTIGEVAVFLFPHKYTSGTLYCPSTIPNDTWTMFFLEVFDARDPKVKKVNELSKKQIQALPFNEVYKAVTDLKEEGNKRYKLNLVDRAIDSYVRGLCMIKCKDKYTNKETEDLQYTLISHLLANLTQCCIQLRDVQAAIAICKSCFNLPFPLSSKMYYRYSKCLMWNGDFSEALRLVDKGRKIDDEFNCDKQFLRLKQEIVIELTRVRELEKRMARGLFSDNLKSNVPSRKLTRHDDYSKMSC